MSTLSPTTRRWMSPPPIYDSTLATQSTTTLRPYLTLPYLLSLTWLAYPIISLLFIAFRLQISSDSAQDAVANAKSNLLTSCKAAEKAATVAASLPRYMAIGTNKQIASAVNGTMNAARATLVLSLTILEAVINFAIDIYRSTFFCFLELVVRGGLSLLIGAVQEINSFLTNTFSGIRTTIQNDIASINSAIQSIIDTINKANPFKNITAPQIDVPDLSSLENVSLPSTFEDALTKLNSSLPTLDQIRDSIKDFIDTPFEDLKAEINDTFAGLDYNASALFVPEEQQLSFCGDMDTSVVDDLGRDLLKITKIGVILLVILALLLIAAHCLLEWYKWRCLQQHLQYTREAWITDPTMNNTVGKGEIPSLQMTNHNLLVLAGSQQHPLLTRISNQLARLLRLKPSQHTNLQWFFHYVFHPPALAVFLIGFLGLLSVEVQLLAIHPLQEKYSAQVASSVADFSNTIATSINASMYNQSATYANQINSKVDSTQSTINDGLFGWVNGTTTTLNDTLVTFYADVQNAVQTVFNGTVLEDPIQEFVRCILGSKIEAIENALTFLHDNLVIDIPRMNETALLLSQDQVDEASKPIAQAAVGDGTDDNSGLVGKIVAQYVSSLEKERIMFAIFIGLWFVVVLIAIFIIIWHSYIRPALNARRRCKEFGNYPGASSITMYNVKPSNGYSDEKPSGAASKRGLDAFSNVSLRSPVKENNDGQDQNQVSWDRMIDSSPDNAEGAQTKKRVSAPRKLRPIGSKAGREQFVSDIERDRLREAESNSVESESSAVGWMKKITTVFQRNSEDNSAVVASQEANGSSTSLSSSLTERRNHSNLTIATGKANDQFTNLSREQLPTASGTPFHHMPPVMNDPPSAWSISPDTTTRMPWIPNALNIAAKKARARTNSSGLPLSPRPIHSPTNMLSSQHKNILRNSRNLFRPAPAAPVAPINALPSTSSTGPANPLNVSSIDPSFSRRDSLLPENTIGLAQRPYSTHRRIPSVPIDYRGSQYSITAGPGPRHGRHASSSYITNPFATPFDDDNEARVIPGNWPKPPSGPTQGSTQAVNPFSPRAF